MPKSKIAMIGAGWWGVEVYVPALLENPDVDFVAINRRDQGALDKILANYDIARGYTDYRNMLQSEDLDAVVITSPHTLHFEHARNALDAGCHVLVDKPMTTCAADARTLVEVAKKNNREILIPYGWNYKDFVTSAATLIADGRIGEIRHNNLDTPKNPILRPILSSPPINEYEGRLMLKYLDTPKNPILRLILSSRLACDAQIPQVLCASRRRSS